MNIVNKILLGCIVYVIWQERNVRLFQSQYRTIEQVCAEIEATVRLRILGLRIRNNPRVFRTLEQWNITWELPSIQSNVDIRNVYVKFA